MSLFLRVAAAALAVIAIGSFAAAADASERVCAQPEITRDGEFSLGGLTLRSGVPDVPGYRARLRKLGIRVPRTANRSARPCVLPNVSFAGDSHNWNGYEGQSPAGSLTGAAAHVEAPEVDDAACENDSVGDWVGVGGPGGDPTLIQTGLFNINDEGTLGSGGFFQVVGGPLATGGAVPFTDLKYVPGHTYAMLVDILEQHDLMFFVVQDTADPENNTGYFQIQSEDVIFYKKGWAQFVSERSFNDPDGTGPRPGRLTAYMKAGTHQFVYTSASAGEQFFRLNELNADRQRLVSRDGTQVLGDSTALDSLGLFDASWRACGTPE